MMKLISHRVVLALATSATAVIATVSVPADASEPVSDTPQSASQALVAQFTIDPTGSVLGNRIFYPDGTVFVAEDAAARSQKDCDSGQFCVWSSTGYTGSFRYRTGTGSKALGGNVGSFWNNRSTVAKLYNDAGTESTCYENGVKKPSVSAAYDHAAHVSLSSSGHC